MLAQNIYDQLRASRRVILDLEHQRKSPEQKSILKAEKQKLRALEDFARMSCDEYLKAYQQLEQCAAEAQDRRNCSRPLAAKPGPRNWLTKCSSPVSGSDPFLKWRITPFLCSRRWVMGMIATWAI
jgi:hypothetical protein